MARKIHLLASGWSLSLFSLLFATGALSDGPVLTDAETVSLYNQGVTLIGQSKPAAAAEKFRQAIQRAPNFGEAHSNLGTALVQLGKYDEALPELKKGTELNPSSAPSWGTLGTCYQTLGHSTEAVHAFKMFLKCAPNSPDAARVRSMVALLENEIKRTAGEPPEDLNAENYFEDSTQNGMSRWPKSRMPITVYIDDNPNVLGFDSQTPAILKAAFQDWQDASKGLVEFKFVTDPDTAEVKCKWTHDASKMMSSAEGGHAMVIPDSQGIVKTDITLLTAPPAGLVKITANYARRIYLHEIGHSLGILGHSKNPNDIMFASIPPADVPTDLTARDKNTLVALYSASDSTVTSHPINMSKMLMSGDPNSTVNQVVRLNSEGADAMKKANLVLAIEKFEEAKKLDPTSELLRHNLGSAYANAGSLASIARNWPVADEFFKKAIPLLEHGSDKAGLTSLLQAYSFVLKMERKTAEAAKIDARVQSLSAGH